MTESQMNLSVETQVIANTSFAENIKARVLRLAHMTDLPDRGRDVLDARVATLILERKVNQRTLEATAQALARQFPTSVNASKLPPASQNKAAPSPTVTNSNAGSMRNAKSFTQTNKTVQLAPTPEPSHHLSSGRSPSPGREYFVEPVRLSVHRKRQLAKADAEYLLNIQRESESYAAEEERRRQERQTVKERMRQDMAIEAQIREQRLAAEREERQRLRAQVQQTTDEIKLADEMDEMRRKKKLAAEKEAIEQQRQARRLANEMREKRKQREDERYRTEVLQGLSLDEELKIQRDREMRRTLLSYLEESKEILHHKREMQRQERLALAKQNETPSLFIGGESPTVARGTSVPVPARVKALCQLQDHVGQGYAAIAEQHRQKMLSLETAALEAERKTAEEQVKRNQMDVAKARSMRAALVASLDLELSIQREREAHEKEDKIRLRKLVDESTKADRAAAEAETANQARRRIELSRQLAAQVAERERLSMSPQPIKNAERPPRFLPKTPTV